MLLGLALLGFTSVYREGFEVVLFLQTLREQVGSSVVLEGVIGACSRRGRRADVCGTSACPTSACS